MILPMPPIPTRLRKHEYVPVVWWVSPPRRATSFRYHIPELLAEVAALSVPSDITPDHDYSTAVNLPDSEQFVSLVLLSFSSGLNG